MKWHSGIFQSLYSSIQNDSFDETIFDELLPDLQLLNLNNAFVKNNDSRTKLEKGEIALSDGSKYNIGQECIIAAITLSDELNLDELIACELILKSIDNGTNELKNMDDSITLVNKGKVQYFLRRQYILQIVSFIVNCTPINDKYFIKLIKSNDIITKNILESFKSIHQQLTDIKQSVNKATILDNNNNVIFQQNIKFKRDFLLKEYDILSQILYGLVNNCTLLNKKFIIQLIDHVSQLESNDFFMIYYLSSLFQAFIKLNELPENEVRELHTQFTNDLKNDSNIYTKPVKVSIIFVFLTFFINWCKLNPATRANVINFQTAVDEPLSLTVELGAIEQLLIFAADTSIATRECTMDIFYDIRSLLERHIPRLLPIQILDTSSTSISNNHNYGQHDANTSVSLTLSEQSEHFFLASFHTILQTIIADCAFLLTKIKDAEEDSLLSGEDLTLDDISVKADLERFFLAIYFFYHSRIGLSNVFWLDKESNAYGFIEWASKCTDSLMRSCFYLMISSLSHGLANSLNVYHYFSNGNIVSWDIIAQCISDYIIKISNLRNLVIQKQQAQETEEVDATTVALEEGLNEETIIFLSSLLSLVESVARETNEEIKEKLSLLFTDILFEFAKVDTPLVGAAFETLSQLVPSEESQREKLWRSLDSLIFKTSSLTSLPDSYKSAFTSTLSNFSRVIAFLKLFKRLTDIQTRDPNSIFMRFGRFTFPTKLGQGYRKLGIWPYFDFILNEILVNSNKINDLKSKKEIQTVILQIITNALYSFDYSVILNSMAGSINLDKLVGTLDFFSYVQESSATAVFNYLFTDKVYKSLIEILSVGIDHLSIELKGGAKQLVWLQSSAKVINDILTYQETYIEELVPIILKQNRADYFMPKDFGLHGLRSFYDSIYFNLSIVAHLGLYIGVNDFTLSSQSLQILKKISMRSNNDNLQTSTNNRLLTIFDSVDESARIKDAFIAQIDSPIDSVSDLSLKLDVLDFINSNLSLTNLKPTISHFLLGFQVTNVISFGPTLSTFINSESSLLKSLTSLLLSSLDATSRGDISYAPIRLASSTFEILLKLCRNPLTSHLVLDYLASQGFFDSLMNLDPQIGKYTLWEGRIFDDNSEDDCKLFVQSESIGALLFFLSYRGHLLQYLSLAIHRLSVAGVKSQTSVLIKKLISNTMYSIGIFSFLDTSNFGNIHKDHDSIQQLAFFNNLPINLEKITLNNHVGGNIYEFSDLDGLFNLVIRYHLLRSNNASSLVPNKDRSQLKKLMYKEAAIIKESVTSHLSHTKFVELQLSIIHSWVQLVQIVVTDGDLTPLTRSNFILEVFGTIVPKINDYVEFDILYSEELVSLTLFLYDIYQKDRITIDTYNKVDTRLYELFKACVHGINSSVTSPLLRSDFYVLANHYLVRVLKEEKLAREVLQDLKMNSIRLVDVICGDAIFGESTNRVTSILLLDSLIQLANFNKENFVLDSLTKSTHLMLITRSMKNINSLLDSSVNNLGIDALLYELTALKTTIYFLTRIAETKNGAQVLIQNKLFSVIEECSFLLIDPDLGLELVFDESQGQYSNLVKISVNLDNPLMLGKDVEGVSLFELIVPIFQLLAAVLISMGSSNKPVIQNVRNLLIKFKRLLLGILKRDALKESNESHGVSGSNFKSLQQMVELIVMLCSLTGYHGEDTVQTFI